jgi:hypothetical protein
VLTRRGEKMAAAACNAAIFGALQRWARGGAGRRRMSRTRELGEAGVKKGW